MQQRIPKLSLGPVLYYWDRQTTLDFYQDIAKTPVDIVYLGETVCSKRKLLRTDDWLTIAQDLKSAGKEVVLSTLTLLEANSELSTLISLCKNRDFTIEANDIAAVQQLKGQPFVTGPAINIYNPRTLNLLHKQGLKRWCLPVELSRECLKDMQQDKADEIETEVMIYGRLPLAYSARCFTARAHNLPKDDCQYRCLDYPDGLLLKTQEDEKFLVLNGIQTQSAKIYNLMNELHQLIKFNVDVLRISPTSNHTDKIIDLFYQCLHNNDSIDKASEKLNKLMPNSGSCNGYWHGESGMDYINNIAS